MITTVAEHLFDSSVTRRVWQYRLPKPAMNISAALSEVCSYGGFFALTVGGDPAGWHPVDRSYANGRADLVEATAQRYHTTQLRVGASLVHLGQPPGCGHRSNLTTDRGERRSRRIKPARHRGGQHRPRWPGQGYDRRSRSARDRAAPMSHKPPRSAGRPARGTPSAARQPTYPASYPVNASASWQTRTGSATPAMLAAARRAASRNPGDDNTSPTAATSASAVNGRTSRALP